MRIPTCRFVLYRMPCKVFKSASLQKIRCLDQMFRRFGSTHSLAHASKSASSPRPLEGIRVVECGHIVAGPFAGAILAYFGAEVIKVEPPTGDQVRDYRVLDETKTSLWWYSIGRNKRSIAIDLKKPQGRQLLKELITGSDVLIENFKPGRMEKWQLGPDAFQQSNPGLIYTRVSGFGQDGPYHLRPGFASVCEAMGGFRYVNGFPGQPTVRQNLSMGDTIAGIHAALGITLALLGRNGPKMQGKGQVVDVAIYESMFNLMEATVPEYDYAGVVRECSGSTVTGIVPSNTYLCADGKEVVIAANTDTLFKKLMVAIGQGAMATDPKFQSNADRVKHQQEIDASVASWAKTRTVPQVMEFMDQHSIPVGSVYSVQDMMQDPHYLHRGLFEQVSIGPGKAQDPANHVRQVKIPAILPKLCSTPGRTEWAGKSIGEDTRYVLEKVLHKSPKDVEALYANQIVF